MSIKRNATDLSMFSHVAIHPHWLMHLAAFQSNDATVVRGAIHMLMYAFRAEQCGVIPNTIEAIAYASQLPVDVVRENLMTLTTGWTPDRGRKNITFKPMAELAGRLNDKYPEALQDMQERAVVAIASPDLVSHELLETQGDPLGEMMGGATVEKAQDRMNDTRVRRVLPEGARLSRQMEQHLIEKGFTPDMHEDMWVMFYSYHKSQNTASASWESEFVRWVYNQIRYGKIVPSKGEGVAAFKATEAAAQSLPPKVRQANATRHFVAHNATNRKIQHGEQLEDSAKRSLENARQAINAIRGHNASRAN